VLQGAAINTLFDVEVVHSTDLENVDRLLAALESLDAFYRTQPERRLRPSASHLATRGRQTLMTKFGALDVLGHIGRGRTYADLIGHTVEMEIGGRPEDSSPGPRDVDRGERRDRWGEGPGGVADSAKRIKGAVGSRRHLR